MHACAIITGDLKQDRFCVPLAPQVWYYNLRYFMNELNSLSKGGREAQEVLGEQVRLLLPRVPFPSHPAPSALTQQLAEAGKKNQTEGSNAWGLY